MKRAVLISFVILLFSAAMVFAQSQQEAVLSNEDDVRVEKPQKTQKVSEIRKRVIKGNNQKNQVNQRVVYDEKGGIVVPNASKGIEFKLITPRQREIRNQILNAKKGKVIGKASINEAPIGAREQNNSSFNQVQKSNRKQSAKSTKEKRRE